MLFWPIFADFWCPVVTVVTFSSNLSNFGRNQKKKKNPKKSKKNQKIKKSKKILKNPKKNFAKKKNKIKNAFLLVVQY